MHIYSVYPGSASDFGPQDHHSYPESLSIYHPNIAQKSSLYFPFKRCVHILFFLTKFQNSFLSNKISESNAYSYLALHPRLFPQIQINSCNLRLVCNDSFPRVYHFRSLPAHFSPLSRKFTSKPYDIETETHHHRYPRFQAFPSSCQFCQIVLFFSSRPP